MDFTAWNWATSFRLHEAACLIAGVMPISKHHPISEELPPQARPILIKLAGAYYEWFLQKKNPERPKSIVLEGVLNEDGSLPPFPALADVTGEVVSRGAIHRFLTLMAERGLKSCYDFGPVGKAEPPHEIGHQAQVAAPAPVADSASTGPSWPLTKPKRFHGYTLPLYRLLDDAHRDGKTCPTARDVLEAWRIKKPDEIAQVLPDEFNYYNASGNTKAANLEAIRKAIGRMTSAR